MILKLRKNRVLLIGRRRNAWLVSFNTYIRTELRDMYLSIHVYIHAILLSYKGNSRQLESILILSFHVERTTTTLFSCRVALSADWSADRTRALSCWCSFQKLLSTVPSLPILENSVWVSDNKKKKKRKTVAALWSMKSAILIFVRENRFR